MRATLPSGTPVELAVPTLPATRGLVVAADVGGLRPLFDEHADRLMREQGWSVAVVEPFPDLAALPIEERLAQPLDVERVVGDLVAAADLLTERTGVARVGIIGFCMGGMNAFRAAGTGRFDRAVAFYGMVRPPEQWSTAGQDPLDALARPECCPTLAIFGGADTWTPAQDIEAAKASGSHVTVEVYDEAEHGFVHDPARPTHRADDAAHAWRAAIEFLA